MKRHATRKTRSSFPSSDEHLISLNSASRGLSPLVQFGLDSNFRGTLRRNQQNNFDTMAASDRNAGNDTSGESDVEQYEEPTTPVQHHKGAAQIVTGQLDGSTNVACLLCTEGLAREGRKAWALKLRLQKVSALGCPTLHLIFHPIYLPLAYRG
jgi:hypothetical protein